MHQERQARIDSMAIVVEYNWMYLHNLYLAASARLGEAGVQAIGAGVRRHGRYRGESIRSSAEGCAVPRDAMALLRAWDTAELAVASSGAKLAVEGGPAEATLDLERVPGSEYFAGKESAPILEVYWREFLAGLPSGYDEALRISHAPPPASGPWRITFKYPGAADADAPALRDAFANPVTSIVMSRRTAGVFSGLCMHTTRALTDRFDATGEKVAREALYNFGVERALGMRAQVEKEGKPLDFQSWYDVIQRRDPNSAAWVFRGDTHISPGVFQVTCTYCPCAEVWAEEGGDGLAFGYIYDMEVHRGLVEGFNPEGVVTWDKVKTRGDSVCNFRFSIPDLVTDEDPPWARGLGNT